MTQNQQEPAFPRPPAAPMQQTPVPAPPPAGRALNPFEADKAERAVGGSVALAEERRAIAEVQAAIMLAKQFPRDKARAMEGILADCRRESLAEAAVYSYTKGGQEVTGPGIRLAEAIAQNWGNIHFGWNEVNQNNGRSEIIAWAWDCETNVRRSTTFYVKHWRDTKRGGYEIKDQRDIYEHCANQAARRLRGCILNIIPGDVIEAALEQAELTLAAHEAVTKDSKDKMIKAFAAFGVSQTQIEKKMCRNVDAFNGANMIQLRKIYNGIKDGMSKAEDFFEPDMQTPVEESAPVESAANEQDWISFVEDLLIGAENAKDIAALDAFIAENAESLANLQNSGARTAIKKWAEQVNAIRKKKEGKLV